MSEHVAQPGLGINRIQFSRADQAVDGGSALTADIGAGKQIVFAVMQIFP